MSSVYLDSNGFAYYFDQHPIFGPWAQSVLGYAGSGNNRLYGSIFALSEVLVGPVMFGDEFKIAAINRYFRFGAVTMLEYPLEAVPTYTFLRAKHRVKSLDALHLACAAHHGLDFFVTNDHALHKLVVPGIGRIVPLDYFV